MSDCVWYLILPVLFVLWRSFPRAWVDGGRLSLLFHDTWFHLLYAEEIAANGHRVPRRIRWFLLSTHVAYPPLMHWLLSFMPKGWRERTEPCWGGLWDGIAAIALLTATSHWAPAGGLRAGLLACGLFLILPSMRGMGWGPRAMHGTPRGFGQMLFTLSTLSFLAHRSTGDWGWFAVAVVAGSLIFVSSMFSVQAFAFLNLTVAAMTRSWAPVFLVVGALAVCPLWFWGYALHLLPNQVRILRVMRQSLGRGDFDCADIQQRNRWRDLWRWPADWFFNRRQARRTALYRNTALILLVQSPLVAACFLWGGPGGGASDGVSALAGAYVWAGLGWFVLTSLRPLLFLGEAERYVEHVIPLLAMTSAFALAAGPPIRSGAILAGLAGVCLWVDLINVRRFVRNGRGSHLRQRQIREVLEWIRARAPQGRFAVLPRSPMNLLIPYVAGGSVLYGQWASHAPPEVLALRHPDSPEFAACREALFSRFGIDHVVVRAKSREAPGIRDLIEAYPILFENEETLILDAGGARRPAGRKSPAG
jgi:hypothetical protein